MLKEALVVGVAGAAGTYVSQKFGASLEAQATKMGIPPMVAHMAVVGGFTAVGFLIARAVL